MTFHQPLQQQPQCYIVHAWASNKIPACSAANGVAAGAGAGAGPFGLGCQMSDLNMHDITARPLMVLWFIVAFPITTQFRGIHFFTCHRGMHPWWDRKLGLMQGDVGAFLYRYVILFFSYEKKNVTHGGPSLERTHKPTDGPHLHNSCLSSQWERNAPY